MLIMKLSDYFTNILNAILMPNSIKEKEDIFKSIIKNKDDIVGGDAKQNTDILVSVLENQASPYLETTVLNAGLGFYANGKVDSLAEGIDLARQLIADGSALVKLHQLQEVQV